MVRVCIFLMTAALIAGMVGCDIDGNGNVGESYTLTIASTAGGNVTSPGEGVFTYDEGAVVNLVVEAEEGYCFVEWTDEVDTIANVYAATTTVTMNSDYYVTANFASATKIWDWYDLHEIGNNLSGNYILMNDLDSTTANYTELASMTANEEKGWQPIADWVAEFSGIFDGQGYEIRDLFINRTDEDLVGLFGCIEPRGVIRDIGVVNASVIGKWDVAGLVGQNWGTVSHCYFTGHVTGNNSVGGVVGYNFGLVSNSYSTSILTSAEECVGGLVGANEGHVTTSYSTGSVTGIYAVGGLVGADWYGGLTTSYSTGNVVGFELVGGLVGIIQGSYIAESYSSGSVTGEENVGGLVGYRWETAVSNSFWDTETSGQSSSAGGTGKTTAEMQDIDTFTDVMWDIIAVANPSIHNSLYIWNIVNNVTYPFLSWQTVS